MKKSRTDIIELPTLNNICYERTKAQILDGTIAWGERIDIGQLAQNFGISKFPVIKAIERLSLEKLVTILPNKGTFVVTPDETTVKEVSQIRNMIEEFACSYAMENFRNELVAEIGKVQKKWSFENVEFNSIDRLDFLKYDRYFHLAIVMCTHNTQLISYYKTIRTQIELYRVKTFNPKTVEYAIKGHKEIANAILNEDTAAVISCLLDHLLHVGNDIEETLHPRIS